MPSRLLCCQHWPTDVYLGCAYLASLSCAAADAQQKGFYSRSIRKLESLLDKGSGGGSLALDRDIATCLNAQQQQLLHLNRALLYLMSGARLVGCKLPEHSNAAAQQRDLLPVLPCLFVHIVTSAC
jgi:hypothetical protein